MKGAPSVFDSSARKRKAPRNEKKASKKLKWCGLSKVHIFVAADLPDIEEAVNAGFSNVGWQLYVLCALYYIGHKVASPLWKSPLKDFKKIYDAETQKEIEEALQSSRKRWSLS
jgi:transposase-like protein